MKVCFVALSVLFALAVVFAPSARADGFVSFGYSGGWGGCGCGGYYPAYGYGYGGYWGGGGVDVYQYTEGTLILDLIEAKSKQLVWRGMAQGTIDENASPEQRERRLNEAVMRMLANFPPPKR